MTPAIWPDDATERAMLEDAALLESEFAPTSTGHDAACHVKALLSRVRELERDHTALAEELSGAREQTEAAAARSQKWKDLALTLAEIHDPLPPGTIEEHMAEVQRRREAKQKLQARMAAGDRRDWEECNRLERQADEPTGIRSRKDGWG